MALPREKPAHPVVVDGFFIDKTEVTNAQFKDFVMRRVMLLWQNGLLNGGN
ncbi:SUMF1/EgtB/PvdO family nonheme iron enzyme [Leeuwenhoekiella sp. MAR_2009_132]|uniref:SUMF1/EgtB/PvdO family nonheme iron enzyme n=1 Tax=Leeuwenhoekiella sp. MAR_2009_132 TaxID=1392489 RepID=UPI001F40D3F7|nr:SUMF1/EgtB/PvdO family nonheme iron enzyme [Leeuwenhoekiella sp. MAR_2009_132]